MLIINVIGIYKRYTSSTQVPSNVNVIGIHKKEMMNKIILGESGE